MAVRNIRQEGDENLSKKSREVLEIDERIKILVEDMIETMHVNNGVGLAAVQVGVLKRVVVIDIYDDKGPIVLINPKILSQSGEREVEEGCLSFPSKFAKVIRPQKVKATYLDINGKTVIVEATDLLAQAICHETDHLEGELFVEKMIPGTLEIIQPEQPKKNKKIKKK